MATLKVVESDVTLDKNFQKITSKSYKNCKIDVEKFIENEDRHESLIAYNYDII